MERRCTYVTPQSLWLCDQELGKDGKCKKASHKKHKQEDLNFKGQVCGIKFADGQKCFHAVNANGKCSGFAHHKVVGLVCVDGYAVRAEVNGSAKESKAAEKAGLEQVEKVNTEKHKSIKGSGEHSATCTFKTPDVTIEKTSKAAAERAVEDHDHVAARLGVITTLEAGPSSKRDYAAQDEMCSTPSACQPSQDSNASFRPATPEPKSTARHKGAAATYKSDDTANLVQAALLVDSRPEWQEFETLPQIKGSPFEGKVVVARLKYDVLAKVASTSGYISEELHYYEGRGPASGPGRRTHSVAKRIRNIYNSIDKQCIDLTWKLTSEQFRWRVRASQGFHEDKLYQSGKMPNFWKYLTRFPEDLSDSVNTNNILLEDADGVQYIIPLAPGQAYLAHSSILNNERGLPRCLHSAGDFRGITYIFKIHPPEAMSCHQFLSKLNGLLATSQTRKLICLWTNGVHS